jgi:DNA-binding SARP family transcriptional activator
VFPHGDLVGATADEVWLTSPIISSDSDRLRTLLARSIGSEEGANGALPEALELAAQGEFLQGHSTVWIDDVRKRVIDALAEARMRAAELSFAQGDYARAQALNSELLTDDPLRESAWRLRMRIANALGDDDEVISTYHRCQHAMAEIGLEPAESTRKLIDQLRR